MSVSESAVTQPQGASAQQQINLLTEELNNERAKNHVLSQKICDFQLQIEKQANQKQKLHGDQLQAMQEQLQSERTQVHQLEGIISQLNDFANNRTSLTRQLEIAQSQLSDTQKQLQDQREDFLAQIAQLKARHGKQLEIEVQEAYARGRSDAEEQQLIDCKLLRDQNRNLQGSLRMLKSMQSTASGSALSGQYYDTAQHELEAQLGKQLHLKNLQVEELKAQIQTLEQQRATDNRQQGKFIKDLLSRHEQERQEFRNQIIILERFIYCKLNELYKIRTLAAAILQKRTNLEQVLYGYLDQSFQMEKKPEKLPNTFKQMEQQLATKLDIKGELAEQDYRKTVISWIEQIEGEKMSV